MEKKVIKMTEIPRPSLPIREAEAQRNIPRAHLVTGHHSTTIRQLTEIDQRLNSGDLTAHNWEPKLTKKLKMSSPEPRVLSVDGFTPDKPGEPGVRDFSADQKRKLWKGMPGRPSEINSSGEVFYVAGDMPGTAYKNLLEQYYSKNATPEARKSALAALSQDRGDLGSVSAADAPDMFATIPTALTALAALTAAVRLADTAHVQDAKTYKRRSILAASLLGGSALLVGGVLRYGPHISVPINLEDNLADTAMRIARREKSDQSSVDGRTALLIEKGLIAAELLDESDATIVAGTAHNHNKENLLSSPQARADAIIKYAQTLIGIVNETADKAGFSNDQKLAARGILLDNMQYGQIFTAKDTGIKQATPGEVDGILKNTIQFRRDFMMGGTTASDAIDTLRQGAPKVYGPFGMNIHTR